jgi:hypothetical protein
MAADILEILVSASSGSEQSKKSGRYFVMDCLWLEGRGCKFFRNVSNC